MIAPRRLHYLRVRNRAVVGVVGSLSGMYALGQIGSVTEPISAALVTILTFSAKLGLLLGLASFDFAQVRIAMTPPSRSSRSLTTTTDTGERADEDDSERQPDTPVEGDPVERARQRYVAGGIGELALETELEDGLLETGAEDKERPTRTKERMTTEDSEHSPKRDQPFRELSWFDRFARLFNKAAIGAGILALGWLLLNAY